MIAIDLQFSLGDLGSPAGLSHSRRGVYYLRFYYIYHKFEARIIVNQRKNCFQRTKALFRAGRILRSWPLPEGARFCPGALCPVCAPLETLPRTCHARATNLFNIPDCTDRL
jgi:hypothetical protein